jgi:hypothetical protein
MLFVEKDYTKIAVISDPHANFATFLALVEQIPKDYKIFVNGDMIDKGKKAKELIDWVMNNADANLGNHDHFMTVESNPRFWKRYESTWLENNGKMSIKSYGDKWKINNDMECRKIFLKHVNWLKSLPLVTVFPNILVNDRPVIVSHSSIHNALATFGNNLTQLKSFLNDNPRSDLLGEYALKGETGQRAIAQDIMWNRVDDINNLPDNGYFNVIGHTTRDSAEINQHCACIDTHVYKPNKLTAILLPDVTLIEQPFIED